jgi:glycosyltransferase involved in cell wall biosynthesis
MTRLRNRRVLMLLQNNPYPEDPRVRRQATALTQAGYHVSVICPRGSGQPFYATVDGVRVYRYPAPIGGNGLLGFVWEYAYSMIASFLLSLYVLLRGGFDVIHTHNPPDTFVVIAGIFKVLGKQFIYDHHDLAPEMYHARAGGSGSHLVYNVLVVFERLSCRFADHVIATNASYRAIEMQRHGVPKQNITIVRNGPELDQLRDVEPDPDLMRCKQAGTTVIGYIGVMGFQDGIDYLLRALGHLVHDLGRRNVLCVLVGDGAAMPSLKTLSADPGITEYIRFTGWVAHDQASRYLAATDICVVPDPSNPYNDRSTMIKIVEYMGLAKPIVAFDLPEHRLSAEDAAAYVEPNNEDAFARSIAALMDDPARRLTMGANGRKRVEQHLAWSYSVPHLLSVYARLEREQG